MSHNRLHWDKYNSHQRHQNNTFQGFDIPTNQQANSFYQVPQPFLPAPQPLPAHLIPQQHIQFSQSSQLVQHVLFQHQLNQIPEPAQLQLNNQMAAQYGFNFNFPNNVNPMPNVNEIVCQNPQVIPNYEPTIAPVVAQEPEPDLIMVRVDRAVARGSGRVDREAIFEDMIRQGIDEQCAKDMADKYSKNFTKHLASELEKQSKSLSGTRVKVEPIELVDLVEEQELEPAPEPRDDARRIRQAITIRRLAGFGYYEKKAEYGSLNCLYDFNLPEDLGKQVVKEVPVPYFLWMSVKKPTKRVKKTDWEIEKMTGRDQTVWKKRALELQMEQDYQVKMGVIRVKDRKKKKNEKKTVNNTSSREFQSFNQSRVSRFNRD